MTTPVAVKKRQRKRKLASCSQFGSKDPSRKSIKNHRENGMEKDLNSRGSEKKLVDERLTSSIATERGNRPKGIGICV